MASFQKSLFKNILISGGYNYLSQGISFFSSIIIARLLTPESYGLIGLITVFTGFITIISDGGLSYALIRSDYGLTYQRVLTNLSWLLGGILFSMTVILAYPISLFYNNSKLFLPTLVLSLTFLIRGFSLAQGALLAKQLRFGFIGKVTLTCMIVSVIITIIMAYFGAQYWSLVVPQISTALITTIWYEREVRFGFKIFPLSYIKVGFKHTKRLILSVFGFNSVNYWSRNSDNMLVGKWYGAADLGIYNRAYSLLLLPITLISALFNSILFPSLKKLQSEGGDIEPQYYFVLRVITFLTYPLVILFILFPHVLVLTLWGKSWLRVATLLPYFGLLVFTQPLFPITGPILMLKGKEKQYMISGWVTAVFCVTAIVLGGLVSLVAVAQYYSLVYVSFVLIFQVVYVLIKALEFNKSKVLAFWLPKITLSILIWNALYFNLLIAQYVLLAIFTVYLLYEGRRELNKVFLILKAKLWS